MFGAGQTGLIKRDCVGTPHSPPLSPPPIELPECGKSRSWLPCPVWYG